jgi:hypothetical protein
MDYALSGLGAIPANPIWLSSVDKLLLARELSREEVIEGMRVVHHPANSPIGGAGQYSTQDYLQSYDLPADPRFDLPEYPPSSVPMLPAPESAFLTPSATPTAFQQAEGLRKASEEAQKQFSFLKGARYDFGRGSEARNKYYSDFGGNMNGLFALDRPDLGFDIWAAIQEGATEGVKKYAAENKITLPGQGVIKVQLPKPLRVIGGSILDRIKARRKQDQAKAKEQAAAQGATVPEETLKYGEPSEYYPPVIPDWLKILGAVAAVGIVYKVATR